MTGADIQAVERCAPHALRPPEFVLLKKLSISRRLTLGFLVVVLSEATEDIARRVDSASEESAVHSRGRSGPD